MAWMGRACANIKCLWWTVFIRFTSAVTLCVCFRVQPFRLETVYFVHCSTSTAAFWEMPGKGQWQSSKVGRVCRSILWQTWHLRRPRYVVYFTVLLLFPRTTYIVKQPFIDPCGLFRYEFIISVRIISPFAERKIYINNGRFTRKEKKQIIRQH